MSTIEEDIRCEIKNLEADLKNLRENELVHLDERISELEKKRFTRTPTKELQKALIVILSLLSFMSVFSTATGYFPLILGSFLSIVCIATLLLFVIVR